MSTAADVVRWSVSCDSLHVLDDDGNSSNIMATSAVLLWLSLVVE